jgi:hypothetical protein
MAKPESDHFGQEYDLFNKIGNRKFTQYPQIINKIGFLLLFFFVFPYTLTYGTIKIQTHELLIHILAFKKLVDLLFYEQ